VEVPREDDEVIGRRRHVGAHRGLPTVDDSPQDPADVLPPESFRGAGGEDFASNVCIEVTSDDVDVTEGRQLSGNGRFLLMRVTWREIYRRCRDDETTDASELRRC